MDVRLIRQLWSVVESAPTQRLSTLDDSGIVQWLMDLLKADPTFDSRQLPLASSYLRSRLPLIRDLAQQM